MAYHRPRPLKSINKRLKLTFGGVVGGLLFFCLSFTPSLLPRTYMLQAVVTGLSLATGYGLGVFVSYVLHNLPKRFRFAFSIIVKKIILALLVLLAIVFITFG